MDFNYYNQDHNQQQSTNPTATNFPTKLLKETANSRQVRRVSAFYRQARRRRELADEVTPLTNESLAQGGDCE